MNKTPWMVIWCKFSSRLYLYLLILCLLPSLLDLAPHSHEDRVQSGNSSNFCNRESRIRNPENICIIPPDPTALHFFLKKKISEKVKKVKRTLWLGGAWQTKFSDPIPQHAGDPKDVGIDVYMGIPFKSSICMGSIMG